MATHPKFGGKQRPVKTPAPEIEAKLSDLPAEEPAAAEDKAAGETPQIIEAAVVAAAEPASPPEREPFAFESALVKAAEPSERFESRVDPRDTSAYASSSAWPFNPFALWTESANALLDFTEELGKARTLCDVVALQSKFASERYESFLKHTNELAEATRRFAAQAGLPTPQGFVAVFTA